jgi:hypothetical protein
MLRDCPIDHRCMTAISPDELFERARALLSVKVKVDASQPTPLSAAIDKLKMGRQIL